AYGKGKGLVMVKGQVVANLDEGELVDRFVHEVELMAAKS
ncbi:MAG: 4-hydroxy-3-methylbut-2-en-1-yl diphosphate synthase, partial [Sulfurimonas sp.]